MKAKDRETKTEILKRQTNRKYNCAMFNFKYEGEKNCFFLLFNVLLSVL